MRPVITSNSFSGMAAVDDWKGLLSKLICENMRISGTLILNIFGFPTMHEVGAL
jgi:hypothetical protein